MTTSHDDEMGSAASTAHYPMENTWEYVHGRIDPGVEGNLSLLESLPKEQGGAEVRREDPDRLLMEMETAEDGETILTTTSEGNSFCSSTTLIAKCMLTQEPQMSWMETRYAT